MRKVVGKAHPGTVDVPGVKQTDGDDEDEGGSD